MAETATPEARTETGEIDPKEEGRKREAAKRQRTALRRQEILERRVAGQTFSEIALRLDLTVSSVCKAYRSALKEHYRTAAVEERETALLRCDGVVRRWWPKLLNEDDEVADRATRNIMRAMDFQADLWGMKHQTVHVEGDVPNPMPTGSAVWAALQEIRAAELARQGIGAPIDATAALAPSENGTPPTGNGHAA